MKFLKNPAFAIKLVISITILIMLAFRMEKDVFAELGAHFHASAWAYAILFLLGQFILLSLRWKYLLNIGKRHLTFQNALQINLTSQLANLVFITSVGGLLARAALSLQYGASLFKIVIATVFDRMMTLAALILLSAAFLPGLASYVDSKTFATLSGYISVFILTLFLFTPVFINLVAMRLPQILRLRGRMRYGLRYLKILTNNPFLCGKILLVSLIAQLSFFLSVFALGGDAVTGLTFLQMMTVLPMISLVASLPISIGGWGVREGAFVYGLGLLGVPMETAFLLSIQVGLISMLVTVLAGMPALMASNLPMARLSAVKKSLLKLKF